MKVIQNRRRLALVIAAALLLLWVLWSQTRVVSVRGLVLAPETYTDTLLITGKVRLDNAVALKAEAPGTVTAVLKPAGSAVRAGEALVALENRELQLALTAAEAALAEARAALKQAGGWSSAAQEATVEKTGLQLKQLEADLARSEALYAAAALSESQLQADRSAVDQKRAELRAETARLAEQRQDAESTLASARARVQTAEAGLESARLQVSRLTVKAPFDGIVTASDLAAGDRLPLGAPAVTLARSLDKTVEIAPDEKYLPLLAPGLKAALRADARPEDSLAGTLAWIAPEVDADTGTVTVRIRMDEDRPWLIQNLMLRCEIQLAQYPDSLSVPADYLLPGEEPALLVYEGGKAVRRAVSVSPPRTGSIRILEGVAAGDTVLPPEGLTPGQRVSLAKPGGDGP